MLRKIAFFLCLIDETPQISLSNIAFLVILCKIITAQQIDWMSLVTLAITCMNLMHDRQSNISTIPSVEQLTANLQKVSDVIDQVKAKI